MTAQELKRTIWTALTGGNEDVLVRQHSSGRLQTFCQIRAGFQTLRAARSIRHVLNGHNEWIEEATEMDRRARLYWNLYADAKHEPRPFVSDAYAR